jgi:Ser/Thr protein kinase RdoA (MazF antagonist)
MIYETLELEAQNAAIRHLAAKPGAPRVPRVVSPPPTGRTSSPSASASRPYQVRLLDYLEGEGLSKPAICRQSVAALGALCGQPGEIAGRFRPTPASTAICNGTCAAPDRSPCSFCRQSPTDAARDRIAKNMVAAVRRVQPFAPALRLQAVHHDVTDDNVVSRRDAHGQLIPDGVIDFGDIIQWLAGRRSRRHLRLAAASGRWRSLLRAARHQGVITISTRLRKSELRALWPLIVARAAVLVASSEQQISIDPDNSYVAAISTTSG